MKLSINLNKIALLRNSRGSNNPDIEVFAKIALDHDILGLTVHPRPDERHINSNDLLKIKTLTSNFEKEFNIEGNPIEQPVNNYIGFKQIINKFKPTQATLVPDSTDQLTSDHGWRLEEINNADFTNEIKTACNRCSIFIDAGTDLSELKNKDIDSIEIYTGPYANAFELNDYKKLDEEIEKIIFTCKSTKSYGLRINAGHDLNLLNLPKLVSLGYIDEVSIGHAIISESLTKGFKNTINQYIEVTNG